MSEPITIVVDRKRLLDLLAHLVAASRQIGLIDEQSAQLAAETALASVDHVGREIAGIVGARASHFASEPPRPIRRGQPRTRPIGMPSRPVDELADAAHALRPQDPGLSALIDDANPFGWRPLPPADEDGFADPYEQDQTIVTSAIRRWR